MDCNILIIWHPCWCLEFKIFQGRRFRGWRGGFMTRDPKGARAMFRHSFYELICIDHVIGRPITLCRCRPTRLYVVDLSSSAPCRLVSWTWFHPGGLNDLCRASVHPILAQDPILIAWLVYIAVNDRVTCQSKTTDICTTPTWQTPLPFAAMFH